MPVPAPPGAPVAIVTRLAQDLAGERHDRRRHRRREEERLPPRREVLEHPADVRQEAHVEHAVGLVEDQDLHARAARSAARGGRAGGRRGHQHVDAAAERLLLGAHSRRRRRWPRRFGVAPASSWRCSSICAASSRVGARTRARVCHAGVRAAVEDRQDERRRLAAAGHGDPRPPRAPAAGAWHRVGPARAGRAAAAAPRARAGGGVEND